MRKMSRLFGIVLTVALLVAGCGDPASFVKDKYQFESVDGSGSNLSKVYRAANQTVQQTAQQIAADEKPDEMSAPNDKDMFLLYSDTVIHVQKDETKPQDALVEVDSKQYVREHYDPSFLEGYLAASLLSNLFGSNWRSLPHGSYHGYDYRYRYPSGGTTGGYKAPSSGGSGFGGFGGFTTPPKSSSGTGKVVRRSKR